ncbi:MAG: hypothetical protein K2Y32_00365 [Candidatus Obscuribacterales bacterium]|nr:hypothetical protein [Candidatus Obscuribacterales bacterium]
MDDTSRVISVVERYLFRVPTWVYLEVPASNEIAAKLKLGGVETVNKGESVVFRDYDKAELIGISEPAN